MTGELSKSKIPFESKEPDAIVSGTTPDGRFKIRIWYSPEEILKTEVYPNEHSDDTSSQPTFGDIGNIQAFNSEILTKRQEASDSLESVAKKFGRTMLVTHSRNS